MALSAGRDDDQDAMDIWLDATALGRLYGQKNTSGSPAYHSARFPSLLPLTYSTSSSQRLHLKWNGLRNADFDLGAIYVGPKNPLFPDPDHDGMPQSGDPPGILQPSAPWMSQWCETDRTSHFHETANSPLSGEGWSDRDNHDDRDTSSNGGTTHWQEWVSPIKPSKFWKLDICRFLMNFKHPEPTLPPAYWSRLGSTGAAPLSSAGAWRYTRDWEQEMDLDADGLPDLWERRYLGSLSSGAQDDPDSDGIPNAQELKFSLHPKQTPPNNDVDGDGLPNDWEMNNGFNVWEGGNQGEQDPDRDGRSNVLEYAEHTDPLIADGLTRTGSPPEVFFTGTGHPPAPETSGEGLKEWMPGAGEDDPDVDGDGVPNEEDAVPYDGNLAFARAPESRYIVVPLMGANNTPEKGQPMVINNAGHVLLAPQPPPGGWLMSPGVGTDNADTSRAARLWRKSGEAAVPVPIPPIPDAWKEAYVAHWNHGGAFSVATDHNERQNGDTFELDLAPDSDLILAHAEWVNKTAKSINYPDKPESIVRIPFIYGRHAFLWDGSTQSPSKWLPWAPPDSIGETEVAPGIRTMT